MVQMLNVMLYVFCHNFLKSLGPGLVHSTSEPLAHAWLGLFSLHSGTADPRGCRWKASPLPCDPQEACPPGRRGGKASISQQLHSWTHLRLCYLSSADCCTHFHIICAICSNRKEPVQAGTLRQGSSFALREGGIRSSLRIRKHPQQNEPASRHTYKHDRGDGEPSPTVIHTQAFLMLRSLLPEMESGCCSFLTPYFRLETEALSHSYPANRKGEICL